MLHLFSWLVRVWDFTTTGSSFAFSSTPRNTALRLRLLSTRRNRRFSSHSLRDPDIKISWYVNCKYNLVIFYLTSFICNDNSDLTIFPIIIVRLNQIFNNYDRPKAFPLILWKSNDSLHSPFIVFIILRFMPVYIIWTSKISFLRRSGDRFR